MPDWSALRRRANTEHQKLRERLSGASDRLIHADDLLKAAEESTGFLIQALPIGDPLLAGAQAFLDRDSEMIWYAAGGDLTSERQRFAQAHEFAHLWLHSDIDRDTDLPGDTPAAYSGAALTTAAQIEDGYSPRERREREANLFAAEFLLPAHLLRHAYLNQDMRADQIAATTGLSETCVFTQLAFALLVPSAEPATATANGTNGAPVQVTLDPSQELAARIPAGPVLVDAGPGTGKTCTLTARILHLIRERAVPPENILALTFSNHAVEEMTDRLTAEIGETAYRTWIGTFHAFGFELLRKEGRRLGLPPHPELLETADAITLLERHLDLLDLVEYEFLSSPTLPFADILAAISRAKDELKGPEQYRLAAEVMAAAAQTEAETTEAAKAIEVARAYRVYQELLQAQGLVDYGDLIARAVELLETFPDIRERWQRQHPHILADEYQDVNRATARLLKLLAGDGKGFWAVGDLRQAIYRFRGASPANIQRFESDFPGGFRLSLGYNYRSRPGLVRLFGGMARQMASGAGTQDAWTAFRSEGHSPQVSLAAPASEEAQAGWLAQQISEREVGGVRLRDQAILVPTNRHAAEIAGLLGERGISVQYAGSLFDRPEIKDLLALLSLASEPDGVALLRVAQFQETGIPTSDARRIIESAREAGQRFPSALQWALENVELSAEGRDGMVRLCDTLLPVAYRGDAWLVLSRYLFETSDYLGPLFTEETVKSEQKRLAIYQLLLTIQQLTDRLRIQEPGARRTAFLARLRRLLHLQQSRSVRIPDSGATIDAVRIMTIHQSKGLEFPVVYLPNLVKGQFPARGRGAMAALPRLLTDGSDSDDGGEEEMFFVALSRARDELLLSRPTTWRGKPVDPAPILERIESVLAAEGGGWDLVSASAPSDRDPTSLEKGQKTTAAFGAQPPQRIDISLSRLRQYQSCPRQYYYRHVLELPEGDTDTAYRTFHRHLQETLDWLQAERSVGRTPTASEVQAIFRSKWPVGGPDEETALVRLLRERADTLLSRAHDHFTPRNHPSASDQFKAELESGSVQLRGDEVETRPDGSLRVTQYLHRRPKKDDHTAEPLALLRLAAKQRASGGPVEVAVHSMASGETREIAEDRRWEPKRVEKYGKALRELADGNFAPRPSEAQCASCPFFFICPA